MNSSQRVFALIPAAGHSRRMGQPKLLLPFGETTVLGQLIAVLKTSDITDICVLVRPDDEPLAAAVRCAGATLICPQEPPAEMRISVELLLTAIRQMHAPAADDGWLLIPADHPLLRVDTLECLIASWRESPNAITLPVNEGRRGHPTIFPWSVAADVFRLPSAVGVNHLLHHAGIEVQEIPVDDPTIHLDLDTAADYERVLAQLDRRL